MDYADRVRRLEEKVAHQERLMQLLDEVVREQELRLQRLVRQVEELQPASGDEDGATGRV